MIDKIEKIPGIALKDKEIEAKKVLWTEWHPQFSYAWDIGVGYGKYFKELKRGKIVGAKCKKCNRILLPVRIFCEWCWRTVDEYVYLKDTGVINTFSVCYTNWCARRIPEPEIPAMIEIDGSNGVAIMGKLGEVGDWKKLKIGMRVKAVWKPASQRIGAITDIKYWKQFEKEE